MIHRPQSIDDIKGRIEVMSKLYEAWNDLKRLQNKTLRIYKEDAGMDRFRETLIHRAKKHIEPMLELIWEVLELYKKDLDELKQYV